MSGEVEALERQRQRIDTMLASFTRLFMILAIAGAALSAIYGLSAGTGRVSPQHPLQHRTSAGAKAPRQAIENGTDPADASDPAGGTVESLTAALIALSIGGAAAASGAAAGFLFGLPRTLTSSEVRNAASPPPSGAPTTPTGSGGQSQTLATNTNLEQISDWLTKIIVGVGLTKLDTLPSAIEAFGDRTDAYFGFGGKPFGIAAGLYFLIVGFFIGYILTRTKLTWIFVGSAKEARIIDDSYDQAVRQAAGEPVDPKTAPLNPRTGGPGIGGAPTSGGKVPPGSGGGPVAATPTSVVTADKTVLDRPIVQLSSPEELAARAAAEARAGRLEASAVLYDDVARADPASRHLADYAGVLGLLGEKGAASSLVSRMETASPTRADTARRKMLVGLLRSSLYNDRYEDAISAGEELVARPDESSDAWARLWLACAYGQQHAQLETADRDDPKIGAAANRVVDLLGEAIRLDPSLKPLARSLYMPDKQSGDDDDLQSLYRDDRIDEILKD